MIFKIKNKRKSGHRHIWTETHVKAEKKTTNYKPKKDAS